MAFGGALLVAGSGAWVTATSYVRPHDARVVGGNLPVNEGATDRRDIAANNSPTLVRSPVDGGRLVVVNRIDSPEYACAVHLSSDGGATWGRLAIPLPRDEEPKCFAPDAAFGADGTLHVSFVTLHGNGNVPNAVWLTSLPPDGVRLSAPVKALGSLAFQVRLVADPRRPGSLYLTWLQAAATAFLAFPETGNPVQFSRSEDGGRTWTKPVRVSAEARARVVAPSAVVGPGGQVMVLYVDLGEDRLDYGGAHQGRGGDPYDGPWELVAARSADRGATWAESVVDDEVVPTERFLVFLPPSPSLVLDREGGRLYAAFTDGRAGDADVWVWRSGDGGVTWDEPVRANDTPRGDGTSQYLPRLAVAPAGRLDVLYYDRRGDPAANVMNEVSLQSSFDGGRSFSSSVTVSDRPFSSLVGFGSERNLPDLGSRLALVSTDQRALAVWTDTRAGTEASRKQDLVRALVEISPPRRLAPALDWALRAGGVTAAATGLGVVVVVSRPGPRRSGASARRGLGIHDGVVMGGDVEDDARPAGVVR
ncbi:MAG: sialidase family protein [Acidimicrobiales bacterium]